MQLGIRLLKETQFLRREVQVLVILNVRLRVFYTCTFLVPLYRTRSVKVNGDNANVEMLKLEAL